MGTDHRSPRYLAPSARLAGAFLGICVVALLAGRLLFGQPLEPEVRFLLWLAARRTPALTTLDQVLTFAGSTFWLVCVVLLAVAWLLWRRRPGEALLVLIADLGSTAITNLVKVLVGRPRPSVVPSLTDVSTLSFPSGHACSSAAVYTALALMATGGRSVRRVALAASALLAAAVAFSRVYLGVHYPSDVAAGLVIGWLWVSMVWAVGRRS